MFRIGRSVHEGVGFAATELVGVHRGGLPTRESIADGVDVVRVTGTARTGNLGRVLRAALWQPRVYRRYRRRSVDVLACHNVWILPMCWLLARRTGAALVYNPHELETETFTMRGPKKWVAVAIERSLVRRCDLVSAVNRSIAEWYSDRYGVAVPVTVGNVPSSTEGRVDLRSFLGVPDHALLYVHTGHLARGRNIARMLEAFAGVEHHLVFLGDGPLRPEVDAAVAQHPNIHWMAPVPPDEIVAHVRGADVGLCLIETGLDLSKRLSSPNKLMEALAADTPVLCTDLAEARRVLGSHADTWVLSDVADLEQALSRITRDDVDGFRASWPGAGTWESEVTDLVTAYRKLAARPRKSRRARVRS
ncbi:glycosyltransferase [Nocardioides aequoreus]|uniref:glycosyltransferase n=1 Tax=Nocardioides aequoreus TaxID=397278 RepID=UPI000A06F97B|nr:glycosyltransferase [Nocardioides aequoreus]